MARIVRLKESELVNIVKRVISEQVGTGAAAGAKAGMATGAKPAVNNGLKAFQLIKAGMDGLGTDEAKVQTGVFTIKNKADYQTCLSYVKKEGYNTIMKYIATDMSYGDEYDETQSARTANWGQLDNNPYLRRFADYLQRFNPQETIQQ
jgi:hypothetical protein